MQKRGGRGEESETDWRWMGNNSNAGSSSNLMSAVFAWSIHLTVGLAAPSLYRSTSRWRRRFSMQIRRADLPSSCPAALECAFESGVCVRQPARPAHRPRNRSQYVRQSVYCKRSVCEGKQRHETGDGGVRSLHFRTLLLGARSRKQLGQTHNGGVFVSWTASSKLRSRGPQQKSIVVWINSGLNDAVIINI